MRKYIIISLLICILGVGIAYSQITNYDPYGTTTPRIYEMTTLGQPSTKSSYYVDVPTLSANDTMTTNAATQTLTNKTLTSPTITTQTATGGTITSATIASPTITGGTQAAPTITNPTVSTGHFATPHMEDPNIGGTMNVQGTLGEMQFFCYRDPNFPPNSGTSGKTNAVNDVSIDLSTSPIGGLFHIHCDFDDGTTDISAVFSVYEDGNSRLLQWDRDVSAGGIGYWNISDSTADQKINIIDLSTDCVSITNYVDYTCDISIWGWYH